MSGLTTAEVVVMCDGWAMQYGLTPRLVVACAVAESNLTPRARRPLLARADKAYWPDVSFGLFQQTVRWCPEYKACGFTGEWPGRPFVEFIEHRYYDLEKAARVALPQLKVYRAREQDDLSALCRYNIPALDPMSNPHRDNYARGLAEADRLLGAL